MKRLLALCAGAAVMLASTVAGAHPVPRPAAVEQNSPVQILPAPSSAIRTMLGPARTLHYGSARSAGLLAGPVAKIGADVEAGMQPQGSAPHPLIPGGVALAAHDGVIVHESAHGYASLYADDAPTLLPPAQRVRTRTDTIYDLASLSKLFTAVVAMQLVDAGRLDLDARVVRYLPAFGTHGKGDITVRQLLTHTSGLAPDPVPALWELPKPARVPAILDSVPQAAAGTSYVYSDINMMTVQLVEQAITGHRLDVLVRDGITRPLRMTSTMYNPPASLLPRIAATEYERLPDRGMVRGVVHDENAWALDGVSGHAGVFSDAGDLAVLAQTLLNGGIYRGHRILSRGAVEALFTNLNQGFPTHNHGIGFEQYQYGYMGALATPYTIGHTGFTGTTFVVDPTTRSFLIFLSNRVHPTRDWGTNNPVRRAVADDLASALPVRPTEGATAWRAGPADSLTATLTTVLSEPVTRGRRLGFDVWFDTEPQKDLLVLEQSSDGTTWTPLPFGLRDGGTVRPAPGGALSGYGHHRWWRAAAVPATGTTQLRWTYRTDALYHGLGVRLDDLRLGTTPLTDVHATGFSPAAR